MIDPLSGVITLTSDLDLDTSTQTISQYLLTIRATDGESSVLHTFNLVLVPFPVFQNSITEINIDEEMALGSVVIELSCEEIGPPSFSEEISLNEDLTEVLRFDGRSNLEIARRIDYESLPEDQRQLNVTAHCSNRYDQNDSITITITVNNINDNPFQFQHPRYALLVSENITRGSGILTVLASDGDEPNADIVYSLQQSANAGDFMISPNTGELQVQSSLDRETQPLYMLTLLAAYTNTTGMVERTSSSVTIHVADVNDESPEFTENPYNIRNITGFHEAGDLVVTVSAMDGDAGPNGEVSYYLSEQSPNFFVSRRSGVIYINSSLVDILYTLNITAVDSGEEPRASSTSMYLHIEPF